MIGSDYRLKFQFDSDKKGPGKDIFLSPAGIQKFYITQSIDSFLPTIKVKFKDPQGVVGQVFPSDRRMSKLYVSILRGTNEEEYNSFYFKVYRRFPDSSHSYELEGLLDVDGIFAPSRTRGWNKDINKLLQELASEMNIDEAEISQSLSYVKALIQPSWTNAKFLKYLKNNLEGKAGEVCFYCFIKNVLGKSYLTFKALEEMVAGPPVWKFIYRDIPDEENVLLPILEYKVYDNCRALGILGAREQAYSYFDYSTAKYVSTTTGDTLTEFPSLSERFLIDQEDSKDSVGFNDLGRNNGFTETFEGAARGAHYRRLNKLVRLWITTWGVQNAAPGDVARLYFPDISGEGNLFQYQYQGFWLIEKVIHSIGDTFFSRLLLSRSGVDAGVDNSLLEPLEKKYSKR